MTDPTMGGMVDPSQGGPGGWHGAGVGSGWFGNRQYEINPKTGMPKAPGWGSTRKFKTKTKVKRWARRNAKAQWRWAKKDIRRVKRKGKRKWNQQVKIARKDIHRVQRERDKGFAAKHGRTQARDSETRRYVSNRTPPDGAIAKCRNCGYEVQYSTDRNRWEHTGKGNASCFGK
jgi:hypothetical protein